MNSLTYGATTLPLPDDLTWPDEFTWQPVEQRTEYTITGALVIEAAAKQSGRPITLSAADDLAWMARATVQTLAAWARLPAQTFTLALRGSSFTVAFDHAKAGVEGRPCVDFSDPDAADPYVVTLRFLEV